MSEGNLTDLLERAADRHEVGSPPLDQMVARSRRARRRRSGFRTLAASVVIVTLIAGTSMLFEPDDSQAPAPDILVPFDDVVPWKAITPGPRPSPDLAVPLDVKAIEVSLTLPAYERQSSPDTARYTFVVRLTNTGDEPVSLDPCPFYRVAFVKDVETGYLNCGEAPSEIPAGGQVDFAMEAPAHDAEIIAREGGDGFGLVWELGTEGAEGARARGRAFLAGSKNPIDIEGEWTVSALTGADGKSAMSGLYAGKGRLSFQDGRFEGTTGCNLLFGTFEQGSINGPGLDFTQIGMTKMACPDEPPMRERLRQVRYVTEVGSRLQLHAENGVVVAVLERETAEPAIGLPAGEIATYEPTGASSEALAYGTLVISNGCLVLRNETKEQLILFDATTTTLTFDGLTLHTTDERGNKVSVKVGDRLSFAGGNGPVPKDRSQVTVPAACENAASREGFYTHGVGLGSPPSP